MRFFFRFVVFLIWSFLLAVIVALSFFGGATLFSYAMLVAGFFLMLSGFLYLLDRGPLAVYSVPKWQYVVTYTIAAILLLIIYFSVPFDKP